MLWLLHTAQQLLRTLTLHFLLLLLLLPLPLPPTCTYTGCCRPDP
jgi:hypothetical protein